MASPPRDALQFPSSQRTHLEPHLPPPILDPSSPYPFVTLTFATSLDSQLSLSPGVQTHLSGPQSKAMTHYLRSRYDAILIGVTTAIVDNPNLNCRLEGVGGYGSPGLEGQPRPVVVDSKLRWGFEDDDCKVLKHAAQGKGRAPFVVTGTGSARIFEEKKRVLESKGGKIIAVELSRNENGKEMMDWREILKALKKEGLRSVMIEGGAGVINTLLSDPEASELVNSVIVTIAPTWLGKGGVVVSPDRRTDESGVAISAARLRGVSWVPLGEDVVLCGKLKSME